MFKRLLQLRLLRGGHIRRSISTQQFIKTKNVGILIAPLSIGVIGGVLIYKDASCSNADGTDKQAIPRRLQRFLSFASVEFNGTVYMTPQDFLDSLILDHQRERVFRNVLHKQQVDKFLRVTPTLKSVDKT